MTWYLAMAPEQPPQDVGKDDTGRVILSFNVVAQGRASSRWLRELVQVLVQAGVGVLGTSIFATSQDVVPLGPGPYLHVKTTGGVAPLGTLADPGAYRRPAAQLLVYGADYDAAEAMALAAHDALLAVRNRSVVA